MIANIHFELVRISEGMSISKEINQAFKIGFDYMKRNKTKIGLD